MIDSGQHESASHLAGCSHLPQLNAALLVCSLVAEASFVHTLQRRVQPAGSCPEAAAQPRLRVGEPRVLHVLHCEPLPIDLSWKIAATPVRQGDREKRHFDTESQHKMSTLLQLS